MAIGKALLDPIVELTADYRRSEIPAPTREHVAKWVGQFDKSVQELLLAELGHVLSRSYFSRKVVESFLSGLVTNEKLTGGQPEKFWRATKCLQIQRGGRSQREMLAIFDGALKKQFGFGVSDCGKTAIEQFVYIDDGLFTGNRILRDLKDWLNADAPKVSKTFVIVIAMHTGGQHYAETNLNKAAREMGKKIEFSWWRSRDFEDRKNATDNSDVLRPVSIPAVDDVEAYVKSLKYPVTLRRPGNVGPLGIFSSEEGRNLVEQEFLKSGVYIRKVCPNLKVFQRPLGNTVLETVGFGSTIVTFRNCPNNAPLVFWAGNPWYPLFSRRTN